MVIHLLGLQNRFSASWAAAFAESLGVEVKMSVAKEGLWSYEGSLEYQYLYYIFFSKHKQSILVFKNHKYSFVSEILTKLMWHLVWFLSSLTKYDLEMNLWLLKTHVGSMFCDVSSFWKITCTGCVGAKGLHPNIQGWPTSVLIQWSSPWSKCKGLPGLAPAYQVWLQLTRSGSSVLDLFSRCMSDLPRHRVAHLCRNTPSNQA